MTPIEVQTEEKQALEDKLQALEEQIATLKTALEIKPDYGMGKGDPAITRWELDQALLETLEGRAEDIRQALERHAKGTYGLCKRCGNPIHPDRLAALPDTELCIKCAQG